MTEIGQAVTAANTNTPVGALQGQRQNVTLEATGQMEKAESSSRRWSWPGAMARRCD